MGSYCLEVINFVGDKKYFCDWQNKYYSTYKACYGSCAYYTLNNEPVPISKADMVFVGAFAGVLFGAVFLFAFYKALISG